ncbi:MAG: Cys-tRNA(Pro) deacylase [Erysipelotrichaceae bacterium]|nr:Cys-tRNA(Pro) deacylase [Erysipelotrichaceae bacterium]
MKKERTNVMRLLDSLEVQFKEHTYPADTALSGTEVAELIGEDPGRVFKTLVTVGASHEHYVFVIPVSSELNLKKAAKAVGEKSIEMIRSRELLPLTGYIHGGCSPIGMKKFFTTTIDESAILYDAIIFSAGKIGFQVEISLDELRKAIDFSLAELTD